VDVDFSWIRGRISANLGIRPRKVGGWTLGEVHSLFHYWEQRSPLCEIGLEDLLMAGFHLTRGGSQRKQERQSPVDPERVPVAEDMVPTMLSFELGSKLQNRGKVPEDVKANFRKVMETVSKASVQ